MEKSHAGGTYKPYRFCCNFDFILHVMGNYWRILRRLQPWLQYSSSICFLKFTKSRNLGNQILQLLMPNSLGKSSLMSKGSNMSEILLVNQSHVLLEFQYIYTYTHHNICIYAYIYTHMHTCMYIFWCFVLSWTKKKILFKCN